MRLKVPRSVVISGPTVTARPDGEDLTVFKQEFSTFSPVRSGTVIVAWDGSTSTSSTQSWESVLYSAGRSDLSEFSHRALYRLSLRGAGA